MQDSPSSKPKAEVPERPLARAGLALAAWSERWFPDPLVVAFLGVVVVFLLGVLAGEQPARLAFEGGKGFWALVPFTMQMVIVIVGGHVVASTAAARSAIQCLARVPRSPRSAVAWVALFSMLTSLISWGLSLIFSGLLVREMARRPIALDYRAAGAAAYLGLGVTWAMGLSSSAAMLMATRAAMPVSLFEISGVVPLSQTIFLWQSVATTAILITVSVLVAYLSAPSAVNARTAEHYDIPLSSSANVCGRAATPGEWLEYSPVLSILVAGLLISYLVQVFCASPNGPMAALNLNTYNLIFIVAGLLLHWRPIRFLRAVAESIPATGGVLLQFPFYAMILGMIAGTGLSEKLAHVFSSVTSHSTFAVLVGVYSAGLGVFIPSGGSKWVVEAPYVMQAAIANRVHLGWVIQIYNASEALPNLINPFWMLPLLGILKLRARDLAGYGMLQLVVQLPIMLLLCWLFSLSIPFVPPLK
jgi:short-chain fatty acids transporter